ncbi:unnamed protein product, partial [Pleuronectes platessa]
MEGARKKNKKAKTSPGLIPHHPNPLPMKDYTPPTHYIIQWSSPCCFLLTIFRASKKSSRRSKNSSAPALPRLGAACLPQHLNTNKIPHHSHHTITTTTRTRMLLHPHPSTLTPPIP